MKKQSDFHSTHGKGISMRWKIKVCSLDHCQRSALCRILKHIMPSQLYSRMLQLSLSAFPFKSLFSKVSSLLIEFSLLLTFEKLDLYYSDLLHLNLPISVLGHLNNNLSTSTFSALPQSVIQDLHTDSSTTADQPNAGCSQLACLTVASNISTRNTTMRSHRTTGFEWLCAFSSTCPAGYLEDTIPVHACPLPRSGTCFSTNEDLQSFCPQSVSSAASS